MFALLDIATETSRNYTGVTKTAISAFAFVLWVQILVYSYINKLPKDLLDSFLISIKIKNYHSS